MLTKLLLVRTVLKLWCVVVDVHQFNSESHLVSEDSVIDNDSQLLHSEGRVQVKVQFLRGDNYIPTHTITYNYPTVTALTSANDLL